MLKASLALVMFAFLGIACSSSSASPPKATLLFATDQPTATVTPTASPTLLPTETPSSPPAPSRSDTSDPVPTPTLFSEVLSDSIPPPAVQQPAPTTVRGGTSLPMPAGTTVVWGGCSSDGECNWFNFYWAPTQEAVMQDGESQVKVQHELCHAHQHWSINGGAPLDPSDYDLESWYSTTEGASFLATIDGLAWPWSRSAVNGLEDFAWTCAYWYLQPAHLLKVSPERYAWAAGNLP